MKCSKCTAENAEESLFCMKCGARLDGKKRCGSCGRDIPDEAVFCPLCGARQAAPTYAQQPAPVYYPPVYRQPAPGYQAPPVSNGDPRQIPASPVPPGYQTPPPGYGAPVRSPRNNPGWARIVAGGEKELPYPQRGSAAVCDFHVHPVLFQFL